MALQAYNTETITRFHHRNIQNTEIVETPHDDPHGPPVPANDLHDLPESDLDIPDDSILNFVKSQCHSSEIWTRLFRLTRHTRYHALRLPP